MKKMQNNKNKKEEVDLTKELGIFLREHIIENPFFNYSANFNQLRKGIYCRNCGNFSPRKISFHFQCDNCHHKDTIQTIILQALSDFNILFNINHTFSLLFLPRRPIGLTRRITISRPNSTAVV